eukprot:gene2883-4726_t
MEERRIKGILKRKISFGTYSVVRDDMEGSSDQVNTHKWTAYLRGLQTEDDISYIKSVTIQLHPSFENPYRTFYSPPYEVTEVGWGEFEIMFSIEFIDPTEKKLDFIHLLKLFSASEETTENSPVISNKIQEIIFVDPKEDLYKVLTQVPVKPKPLSIDVMLNKYLKPFNEKFEIEKYEKVMKEVDDELKELLERYEYATQESVKIREEIDILKNK